MSIKMVGLSYAGLVSEARFAQLEYGMACIDENEGNTAWLPDGMMPICECALVARNVDAGRPRFGTDLAQKVGVPNAVCVAADTPSQVWRRLRQLGPLPCRKKTDYALKHFT